MVFRRNTVLLILRLLVILVVMMGVPFATSFIEADQLVFTYLVIFLVLVLLVIELLLFLNRNNRELSGFLENIRNRDFSIRFNEEELKGTRRQLYRTFNEVLQIYRDIRIEKEIQYRFLEHITELIEVGIMVIDREGKIVMMNTSAGNLLGTGTLATWDQVRKKNPEFAKAIDQIERSGRVLYGSGTEGSSVRLVIHANRTTMLEEPYTLLTFQDISPEVEENETGAYVKLMRTLNHEIKNSVAPISSLADTIMLILKHQDGSRKSLQEIDSANLDDIITSLETLQQRSNSLHEFIEEYHKLTRIPAPITQTIPAKTLFEETLSMFEADLANANIRFSTNYTNDIELRIDPAQIQQVLINLITNSIEALSETPEPDIELNCMPTSEGITVSVRDNGGGISTGDLENIFIPFYTTKKSGSGIGLSLVRQIMRLHGGNVRVSSKMGEGTTVYLDFQG
jgi:nitrogen fixation/metabolism regulation signal transduction histidine kinase